MKNLLSYGLVCFSVLIIAYAFVVYSAENDAIEFLSYYGWQVEEKPIESAPVIIPEEFDTIFEDLLSRARAKHIISYKDGKSSLSSFYTSSFFYNREMMERILKNRFAVNGSALADFWKSHKMNLTVFDYHPDNKNVFTSNDSCLFEEVI